MSTTPAKRFRDALDLAEAGVRLMRQNLRRRYPDASPEDIERLFREWLARRPPDCPGRPRPILPR